MKAQDLLSQFPEKSFSDLFKEKVVAIQAIGAPVDQVQEVRKAFEKLFSFDELLVRLKEKLSEGLEREINPRVAGRISYLISQLVSLNSYLENGLNYSEPRNVNQIFQQFRRNVNYLFQEERYNIDSSRVSSGKSVIDELLLELDGIISSLDSVAVDSKALQEAQLIAEKLVKNSEKFERAAQTAENWIKSEGRAVAASFEDKSLVFKEKADEHKSGWVWGWFGLAMILGGASVGSMLYFIHGNGDNPNLSIGGAFLRISILVVISYFSFYCIQQFTNHRKLYEAYRFKAIALKTMEELVKSYTEPSDKERILDKAIGIIFSEPSPKEEKIPQKKLMDELFDLLKKKI
ncbi:MAG: hypothetical protein HGA33_00405 [Candidatus Moranbacteria bacterium]|nr:hypothetical protein [Candidatus Moranbacteria bacterium]